MWVSVRPALCAGVQAFLFRFLCRTSNLVNAPPKKMALGSSLLYGKSVGFGRKDFYLPHF